MKFSLALLSFATVCQAFSPLNNIHAASRIHHGKVQRSLQNELSFNEDKRTVQRTSTLFATNQGFSFEFPPIFGAPKAAGKKLVVITGTSSGLGRECAKALIDRDYFVICAVRDIEKMYEVANENEFNPNNFAVLELDLASLGSVRKFVSNLKAFKSNRPLTAVVCNAAVYLPTDPKPRFTAEGFEMSMGVNHLAHFYLCSLLLDDMMKKKTADQRMIIVGSITGNTNTVGGGVVYPFADLGQFQGFEQGFQNPICMSDGKPFFGAKAYKDAKLCNMQTMLELHDRYHEATGITFSSMYPGCIAETALFREKRAWFRQLFPVFMKYVTGGYVGQEEAGERLAQCVYDEAAKKSGVYWSWNGGAKRVGIYDFATGQVQGAGGSGGSIFENELSGEATNIAKRRKMWDLSTQLTGAVWPQVPASKGNKQQELVST